MEKSRDEVKTEQTIHGRKDRGFRHRGIRHRGIIHVDNGVCQNSREGKNKIKSLHNTDPKMV